MVVDDTKPVNMNRKTLSLIVLIITPVFIDSWRYTRENRQDMRELPERREIKRGVHYHSKRHMLPESEQESMRRVTTQKTREARKMAKKPSGHLTPLEEDDMDNDEVVSVAIGPPPIRPKYDKVHWKQPPKSSTITTNNITNSTASNLVKDLLTQLGRELLSRQISEDFIFGQYLGNAMKNLTADLKLKMQHEVLELIVRYQKLNRGEMQKPSDGKKEPLNPSTITSPIIPKELKPDKKFYPANETEDTWPDFSNLEKIVG